MEEILYPANGYRGALQRKGILPKDHQAQNLRQLKEKRQEFLGKQEKAEEGKKESM